MRQCCRLKMMSVGGLKIGRDRPWQSEAATVVSWKTNPTVVEKRLLTLLPYWVIVLLKIYLYKLDLALISYSYQ